MTQGPIDKRIGGMKRAKKARVFMMDMMANEAHPMRFAKDTEFAKKFDVSRHTIYKMRRDLDIPDRPVRILDHLRKIETSRYTMRELCALLNIKYAGLYKIVTDNNLPIRADLKSSPLLRQPKKI